MGYLRQAARLAWSDRRTLQWVTTPEVSIAYLGWVNRGNLGDEAMYEAAKMVGNLPRLRAVPLHRPGRILATRGRASTLIVGGGTLLGRPEWLVRIREARRVLRPDRMIVLGTGVEPLAFGESRRTATLASTRTTALLLKDADFIGVRGPHSKEELGQWGVEAHVIGDPALALAGAATAPPGSTRKVAINLANVADGLIPDRRTLLHEISRVCDQLIRAGSEVSFFAMEKSDLEMAKTLPRAVTVLPWSPNLADVLSVIDSCDVIVSERLHGGILAAARRTPFVLLGYKPKILDFAASVDATHMVIPSDAASYDGIITAIDRALDEGFPHSISDRVASLSSTYRDAFHEHVFSG